MVEAALRVGDLAAAATEYCGLVEHLDRPSQDWLEQVSCLLPRIHAAVILLQSSSESATCPPLSAAEYDRRFELFSRLRDLLRERDIADAGVASDSLADDIADIYFELRRGLDAFSPGHPDAAARIWCSGFLWHWGQHLVDAERRLYELEVNRRLFRSASD